MNCYVCEFASANIFKVAANEFFRLAEKSQHRPFYGRGRSMWKRSMFVLESMEGKHTKDSKSRHSRSAFRE